MRYQIICPIIQFPSHQLGVRPDQILLGLGTYGRGYEVSQQYSLVWPLPSPSWPLCLTLASTPPPEAPSRQLPTPASLDTGGTPRYVPRSSHRSGEDQTLGHFLFACSTTTSQTTLVVVLLLSELFTYISWPYPHLNGIFPEGAFQFQFDHVAVSVVVPWQDVSPPWRVVRAPSVVAPYAVRGEQWIGYDDDTSIREKVASGQGRGEGTFL